MDTVRAVGGSAVAAGMGKEAEESIAWPTAREDMAVRECCDAAERLEALEEADCGADVKGGTSLREVSVTFEVEICCISWMQSLLHCSMSGLQGQLRYQWLRTLSERPRWLQPLQREGGEEEQVLVSCCDDDCAEGHLTTKGLRFAARTCSLLAGVCLGLRLRSVELVMTVLPGAAAVARATKTADRAEEAMLRTNARYEGSQITSEVAWTALMLVLVVLHFVLPLRLEPLKMRALLLGARSH